MGIKGLKRLIADNAPEAIHEAGVPTYFGRSIAIDASMFLYSFLVAIRQDNAAYMLTDASGETTRCETGERQGRRAGPKRGRRGEGEGAGRERRRGMEREREK